MPGYLHYSDRLGSKPLMGLGRNVVLRRAGESLVLTLHSTDILVFHADGTFEADNGGYATATTASAMTRLGPDGFVFRHVKGKLVCNGQEVEKGRRYFGKLVHEVGFDEFYAWHRGELKK